MERIKFRLIRLLRLEFLFGSSAFAEKYLYPMRCRFGDHPFKYCYLTLKNKRFNAGGCSRCGAEWSLEKT